MGFELVCLILWNVYVLFSIFLLKWGSLDNDEEMNVRAAVQRFDPVSVVLWC